MKTILFFDTSRTGAGCLMSEHHPWPTLLRLVRIEFDTKQGQVALEELFAAAEALKDAGHAVFVSCERVYTGGGRTVRDRIIRDAVNQKIGMLKSLALRHGLKWGGDVSPSTAKKALTGNGRSGKPAIIAAANRIYGAQLGESYPNKLVFTGDARTCHEHEADAISGGVCAMYGRYIQQNAVRKRVETNAKKKLVAKCAQGGLF